MSARLRAVNEAAITTGYYAAVFAGQRRLKPLREYLQTDEERRSDGVRKMIAMAKAKMKSKVASGGN